MALNNSFYLEGEVAKPPETAESDDGVRAYKLVLQVERGEAERAEGERRYDYLDVYAYSVDGYDPWQRVRRGMHVGITGEVRQDKGGDPKPVGIAVRLVHDVVSERTDGGVTVMETTAKQKRLMAEAYDEED